jgi:hypothetical protein
MKLVTANAGRATQWNTGAKYRTDTSSVVGATLHALDQTIAVHNAMPATSGATASNGCLVSDWMNITAMDTVRGCTDCHDAHTNLQNSNMKITSNSTKATLQPYSQDELREIAENVRQYQRERYKDYAYTNESGQLTMHKTFMREVDRERLFLIQRDVLTHGSREQETTKEFTLKVIGTTFC